VTGQDRPAPSSLSPEVHLVARGTMVNIATMVVGAGLSFALTVLLSHWLQPRNTGAFFELIALYTIVSTTLQLGADVGLTRWISVARDVGGLGLVRRVVAIVVVPVLAVGFLASTIVWVTAPAIARTFLHGMVPAVAVADVRIVGVLVPLGALSTCILAGARGYGRMWPYLAVEGLGKPIARMCLVLVALVLGLGLQGALIAWGVPVIFGLVAAWLILAHFIRTESLGARHRLSPLRQFGRLRRPPARQVVAPGRPAASARRLGREGGRHQGLTSQAPGQQTGLAMDFWRFAGPRGFAGVFQIVVVWLDILLVGAMLSRYAAGVYGAVSKLAVIGLFALEGTRLAIGPQLSVLLARKEHARTADLYQSATRWLMMVSWPVYVVFIIFPVVVLGIFGHRYTAGAASLVVLSVAMLVSLGTGNVTVVLLMGGKSSWNVVNALAALAVNVGLNLVLLPRIGILGAAIAWAASIVVDNVAAVIEVWLLLHLRPFGPGYGLVVAATVGCFGITGLAARALLGESLPALVVAVALGGAVFGVVAYLAAARLQLAGLVAALLQRRPVAATGEHGPQPSYRG
jgi:O-antigen/teichoic acid export membrane protein